MATAKEKAEMEELQRELASTLNSMSMDEARAALQHAREAMDALRGHEPPYNPKNITSKASKGATSKGKATGHLSAERSEGSNGVNTAANIALDMKLAMKEAEEARAEMARLSEEVEKRAKDAKAALASLNNAEKEKIN